MILNCRSCYTLIVCLLRDPEKKSSHTKPSNHGRYSLVMTSWHVLPPWRWEWDHVMPLSAFLVTWVWWCQECHPAPDAHSSCGCHHLRRNLVRTSTRPASISQANSELITRNLNLPVWNNDITSFHFHCTHCWWWPSAYPADVFRLISW